MITKIANILLTNKNKIEEKKNAYEITEREFNEICRHFSLNCAKNI